MVILFTMIQLFSSGSNFSTVSRLETPSKPPQTNSLSPTETAPTALKKTKTAVEWQSVLEMQHHKSIE